MFVPDGGQGECQTSLSAGAAQILAECIQTVSGGGYVIESRQLDVNGMVLEPKNGGPGIFKVLKVRDYAVNGSRVELSGPAVNVELLNTPIGNVVLGGYDLETEPLELGIESAKLPVLVKVGSGFASERAHDAGNGKGLLLMSLGAGKECESGSKEVGCCPPDKATSSCATLPGNFPFAGEVLVYLSNKGQVVIDVQVSLNLHEYGFEASGELEIVTSLETGIDLGLVEVRNTGSQYGLGLQGQGRLLPVLLPRRPRTPSVIPGRPRLGSSSPLSKKPGSKVNCRSRKASSTRPRWCSTPAAWASPYTRASF